VGGEVAGDGPRHRSFITGSASETWARAGGAPQWGIDAALAWNGPEDFLLLIDRGCRGGVSLHLRRRRQWPISIGDGDDSYDRATCRSSMSRPLRRCRRPTDWAWREGGSHRGDTAAQRDTSTTLSDVPVKQQLWEDKCRYLLRRSWMPAKSSIFVTTERNFGHRLRLARGRDHARNTYVSA
jgi:hypothetical protein